MDRQRDRRSSRDSRLVRSRSRLLAPRSLRATRAGWCFIAIIFGVGFAALNTGNNLLYLVLALMLAFLVLSGLLSETSLRRIRVERLLPREIFAGSTNRIVLRIHNEQRRNASFAITIEDRIAVEDGLEAIGRSFALRVAPGAFADRSYLFEPERRGDLDFQGFRVSTRFPFGLFIKSRDLVRNERALVYPSVSRVPIDAHHAAAEKLNEQVTGTSNDGDQISGLREFVAGDSLARVQWRSSIRTGRLVVGEREGQDAAEFEVQLSLPPQTADRVVEERVARAASEVVTYLESGSRVGLRSTTHRLPPANGFAHRAALLSYLARVMPDPALPTESLPAEGQQ
jgi:uncharacterized protein (DUF58 family)